MEAGEWWMMDSSVEMHTGTSPQDAREVLFERRAPTTANIVCMGSSDPGYDRDQDPAAVDNRSLLPADFYQKPTVCRNSKMLPTDFHPASDFECPFQSFSLVLFAVQTFQLIEPID